MMLVFVISDNVDYLITNFSRDILRLHLALCACNMSNGNNLLVFEKTKL